LVPTEQVTHRRPNDTETVQVALLSLVRLIARQAVGERAEEVLNPTKEKDDDAQYQASER
jgi:hypothetical protein